MKTLNVVEGTSPHIKSMDCKSRLRNELIASWTRNPHGRITASVTSCALDCKWREAKVALDELYEEGLIETCDMECLTFYALTDDESKCKSLCQCSASGGSK